MTVPVSKPVGMGAMPKGEKTAFRVWAPHARKVAVIGSFNGWDGRRSPMEPEGDDCWYAEIAGARPGHEYRYLLETESGELSRIDPYAREVTDSAGNGVIHDPAAFDWGPDGFRMAPCDALVIYELHIGTFHDKGREDGQPGTFHTAIEQLEHLGKLGINAIEIMPVTEFSGARSWGYDPAHIFAVESSYGGPVALKALVKECHRWEIAVVLDVVYNHFGPRDVDLWRFDGWSENDLGGIYFFNDWRAETPWGHSRPDYTREPVRRFIVDNALMWLDEYRIDGLRVDGTVFIRTADFSGDKPIPEGYSLLQELNAEARRRFPGRGGPLSRCPARLEPEPAQADRPSFQVGGPVEPLEDPQRPDDAPEVAEPEPEPLEAGPRRRNAAGAPPGRPRRHRQRPRSPGP